MRREREKGCTKNANRCHEEGVGERTEKRKENLNVLMKFLNKTKIYSETIDTERPREKEKRKGKKKKRREKTFFEVSFPGEEEVG